MKDEFDNFIMERSFETLDANGSVGTIRLRVGQPYLKSEAETRGKWRCPFQIIGTDIDHSMKAPGNDSLETVLMSLRTARIILEDHSKKHNIKITWQGYEDLGLWLFPSDETVSSDKKISTFDFEEIFNDFFRTYGKR